LYVQYERTAIYEYGAYNLNIKGLENRERVLDGYIEIEKKNLLQILNKQKMGIGKSGNYREIFYEELLESGTVQIKNCSHSNRFMEDGYDVVAIRLLLKLLAGYQTTGELPDAESLDV